MLNHAKSHTDNFGTIDLLPSMEPMETSPPLNGHIIQTNNKQFRVERYQWDDSGERKIGCQRKIFLRKEDFITMPKKIHCYVFIDITMGGKLSKSFAKTPTYVQQAIKEKKITITNTIFP